MEGVTVLDFDMLCSTVALQTQGKWRKLESGEGDDEGLELGGGVFRMWEGEVLDCFEDRRVALQSSCCPCYRFGKNMKRAGFGSCFMQGTFHFVLAFCAFFSVIAFAVTKRPLFIYLAVAFAFSLGTYMGLFRAQIRKKFNIKGSDSSLDDCVYHFICPCCALCQESRTLEMNNVQDGIWHGRGDTICVATYNEGSKAIIELNSTPVSLTKCPDPCTMQKGITAG
ncbi:hypothetical protein EUGRSUZ_E03677 [Eucalyptus grandis]|uniref:PLAC8 family protein n=3 Tax=Eucalyptus TaxID=3932 RepID=A0A059C9W2_EUCGR|nr:hypothetical protein EUGRSUZ_E03677 [Eucalyptus grandis]